MPVLHSPGIDPESVRDDKTEEREKGEITICHCVRTNLGHAQVPFMGLFQLKIFYMVLKIIHHRVNPVIISLTL